MTTSTSPHRSFKEWVSYVWHEGMARHVFVFREDHTPLDLPLIVVILGALLAPWLLAIGVVVALVAGYRLEIRRTPDEAVDDALAEGGDLPPGPVPGPPDEPAAGTEAPMPPDAGE